MPRKRTSTAPRYERAKLNTPEQINFELKKAYRAYRNKTITAADLKNQRETLVALRNGLPDPIERPGVNARNPPEFRIFSVSVNCFLSPAQIQAAKHGESVFDVEQCEPFEPTLESSAPANSVVEFPRLPAPASKTHEAFQEEIPLADGGEQLLQAIQA